MPITHASGRLRKIAGPGLTIGGVALAVALVIASPARASVLGFVEYEGNRNNHSAPRYYTLAVAESPDGKFVYSLALGNDSDASSVLNVHMRDADSGALQFVTSLASPDGAPDALQGATALEMSPNGKFIYVHGYTADALLHAISWFARDEVAGSLRYAGQVSADQLPTASAEIDGEIRVSGDGSHLYVAGGGVDGFIAVFQRAQTGELSYTDVVRNGSELRAISNVTISADGRNVYALARTSKSLVS